LLISTRKAPCYVARGIFKDTMPVTYDKIFALDTVYFGVPKNQTLHVDNDGIISKFLTVIKLNSQNFSKKKKAFDKR